MVNSTQHYIKSVTGFQPLIDGINADYKKSDQGSDLNSVIYGEMNSDDKNNPKKVSMIQENDFYSTEGRGRCALHAIVYLILAIVGPIIGLITMIVSPIIFPLIEYGFKTLEQQEKPKKVIDVTTDFFFHDKADYFETSGSIAGLGALALTCSTVGFGLSFCRALSGALIHPKFFINIVNAPKTTE